MKKQENRAEVQPDSSPSGDALQSLDPEARRRLREAARILARGAIRVAAREAAARNVTEREADTDARP